MSELPDGWSQQPLNNIASLKTGPFGSALKKSDYQRGATPVVNPMHINAGKIYPSHDMTVSQQTLERLAEFRLTAGDVVMGRRGEMGKCAVINEEQNGWLCGSGSFIVRPTAGVDSRYLQRFLSSPSVVTTLMQSSVGSTMVNLNQEIMRSLIVPLAPLAEQKRIADKLDALLARVDGCRARLARVPAILKRFRQAVLAAATSGQLTADWREENPNVEPAESFLHSIDAEFRQSGFRKLELPISWSMTNFGSIVESIRGGSTAVPKDEPTLFPILRSSSVRPGLVDLTDIRYLSEDDSQNEQNFLREGDLLFTRLSGSLDYVANCAMVRALTGKRIQYPDRLFCARVSAPMNTAYCELAFGAPIVRAHLTVRAKSSAGHQRVSITDVVNQLIPIPPIQEQHEIVRRVETLFGYADRLEARYTAALTRLAQLTPALLAKAFRGELVAQDSADEPAALLLERVQAARGAMGESRTRRRSGID